MQEVCHALDNLDQGPVVSTASVDAEEDKLNWRQLLRVASPMATAIIVAIVLVPRLCSPWRTISAFLLSTRHDLHFLFNR
jgi:hypothetical protein